MLHFKDSKIDTYRRMWHYMKTKEPAVFVKNARDGVEKVLAGNYAYLMESTSIEYEVQQNCDLMQVGGLLDSKGFGVATPMGKSKFAPFLYKRCVFILITQTIAQFYTFGKMIHECTNCSDILLLPGRINIVV